MASVKSSLLEGMDRHDLGYCSSSDFSNATSADDDVPPCVGATQPYVFIPLLLLAVLAHACHAGPLQAWLVLSLRETRSRYSALGIAYNLGAMLLGGTFPLIATSIAASALGMTGAGLYLSFGSLVAAITLILTEKFAPTVEAEALARRHETW